MRETGIPLTTLSGVHEAGLRDGRCNWPKITTHVAWVWTYCVPGATDRDVTIAAAEYDEGYATGRRWVRMGK